MAENNTMTTEQLEPCAHCGAKMLPFGGSFNHALSHDCWLSGIQIAPHEFESWNRRTPVEQTEQPGLSDSLETFRDTVLHQRGALAENGMTGDQINDVLSEFDSIVSAQRPGSDNDGKSKQSIAVLEAVTYWNSKWPAELHSGVMFFKGQRITKEEFLNAAKGTEP